MKPPTHSMQRRSPGNNYHAPGIYHVTINVYDRRSQSLGRIVGNLQYPDGHPDAPRVELTTIGRMVEHELLHSIPNHYPLIEIQDYVIMPEHLHVIINVRGSLVSKNGRMTHLGQVIAGFKTGCNRRYWEITGQGAAAATAGPAVTTGGPTVAATGGPTVAAKPLPTAVAVTGGFATSAPEAATTAPEAATTAPAYSPTAPDFPTKKLRFSTGRTCLFSPGYVDVIPLRPGQLETQRAYIRANPRNRLLRTSNPATLHTRRQAVDTLVTPPALRGYLIREHVLTVGDTQPWQDIRHRLLTVNGHIVCDSYGDLQLLHRRMLPVVCHRKDRPFFAQHKQACLHAAHDGAVLLSARIAKGEQDIMDTVIAHGHPVVLLTDNGFPAVYHPSESRLRLCDAHRLLLLSPWTYQYRPADENITVVHCKTMNCIAQALCHIRDDWWQ